MNAGALILGIDGGGAKTAAWLARVVPPDASSAGFVVVGRGRSGPSNPQAVGIEASFEALRAAIADAFRDAGIGQCQVAAAVAALAGSSRPEVQQALAEWNGRESLSAAWRVTHDGAALLAAGAPEGWGAALIAGAGSLAFGENSCGQVARAGGWGYWFGDQGSAFAIGRDALRTVAAAADGTGAATRLTETVCAALGIANVSEMAPAIHGAAAPRTTIASLAPHVSFAAQSGDAVAQQILDDAVVQLANMVQAVAERLGFRERRFPLALGGGVLIGNERLAAAVVARLQAAGFQPTPVARIADPVVGAVALARRLVAE